MNVVSHQDGPVLGWVGTLVYLLGDHLAQPSLLREPFARRAGYGMPAEFDGAGLAVDLDLVVRNHIRLLAQAELMFNPEGALE